MKIASYNIMSGGFDDYTYDSPSPQRLSKLQSAILALNADVIGLVDTFRWDELYTPADMQRLFGYEHAAIINLNDDRLAKTGHNNGLTILSRVNIRSAQAVTIGNRDALHVQLTDGTATDIFLTYLDDLSEDTRMTQLKHYLAC